MSLGNFSEFGLIVAALGVKQGWLPVDWLLVVAIAVSVSFAIASPFTSGSESAYQRFKSFWDRFQIGRVHPNDQMIDTGDSQVLIIGMGRVGSGAYDELSKVYGSRNAGIDCQVVAIAQFAEEIEELAALNVPSFNMYSEAGFGLARHALDSMAVKGTGQGAHSATVQA